MTKIIRTKVSKESLRDAFEKQLHTMGIPDTGLVNINIKDLVEVPVTDAPEIEILFNPDAYARMCSLVMASNKEIAWHGIVTQYGNQYLISDIMTYPQIVAAATVNADEAQYVKWVMERINYQNQIRMQGHSHVDMSVFASGVDLAYYNDLIRQVDDYYIFVIMNRKNEIHVRFYDQINGLLYTDLPVKILGRTATPNNLPLDCYDLKTWHTNQMVEISEIKYATPPAAYTHYSGQVPYGVEVVKEKKTGLKTQKPSVESEMENFTDRWNNILGYDMEENPR